MDDLSERLFAHFVGGRWRVPFGTSPVAISRADGTPAGTVLLADAQDIARAKSVMCGVDATIRARLASRLAPYGMAEAIERASATPASLILCSDTSDRQALGTAFGRALSHGLIWCPPPQAALLATEIAMQLQEADLPPGCFALLHAYTPQTDQLIRATSLARAGTN